MHNQLRSALLVLVFGLSAACAHAATVDVSGEGSDFYKVAYTRADAQFNLMIEDEPAAPVPTLSRVFVQEGAVAVFGGQSEVPAILVPDGANSARIGADGVLESWQNVNLRTFGLQQEPYRINILVEEGEPLILRTNYGVKEVPEGFFSTQFAGGPPEIFDTRNLDRSLKDVASLEGVFVPGSLQALVKTNETKMETVAKGGLD